MAIDLKTNEADLRVSKRFFLLKVRLFALRNKAWILNRFWGDALNVYVYRSCIALFYRKRLPQQNGDRRIGERETSMHLIVCGSEVGTRTLPSPPHAIRGGPGALWLPPPLNSTQTGQFQ
jgi:hypothetical protein